MFVVCDIETERLDNPQVIHIIVCKETETGKVHVFRQPQQDPKPFLNFASKVTCWIGHNFIGFDRVHLQRLTGVSIDPASVIDTLIISRLINYSIPGGHSLEAWGDRLGSPKIKFNDFSKLTPEMETYCIQDVETNYKLFLRFKPYCYSNQWTAALRLEHDIAYVCQDMQANGFHFNIEAAKALHKDILRKLETLDNELLSAFPPKASLVREITPRATKHGTLHRQDFRWLTDGDLTPYSVDSPFSLIEWVPFNPGSPKQIVERLNEAGWKPHEKTKGHILAEREGNVERLAYYATYGWKVSEANLTTLPQDAPEASRKLVQRLLLDSRRSTLEEWFKAFSEASGRIHGTFNHIGAWTHRMSHAGPNMANIPAHPSLYADEMRAMWDVPKDKLLVGVDAEGIQLRVLAHYMNDKKFTQSLIEGKKEEGTDPHTLNMKALGHVCKSREDAKTFIYAFLLGAGTAKVAQILGCTNREAKAAVAQFIERNPGLKRLKEEVIPRDAERGYFEGLDGRLVMCDSAHHMLAGYLQNGECVIMKRANILWRQRLREEGIPFMQVNFVHDEWQTEVDRDMALAKRVAEIQADSIRQVGLDLNLNCPMAGSFINTHKELAIGANWSLTH